MRTEIYRRLMEAQEKIAHVLYRRGVSHTDVLLNGFGRLALVRLFGVDAGQRLAYRPGALRDTLRRVRKTSVYLSDRESRRLVELARAEGRSQAEIIREAITAYVPTAIGDDDFALAAGFPRRDDDPRPISGIPEDELLDGFGE
jgi:predicted DNA-binding protein